MKSDIPITEEYYDYIQYVLFSFFHNNLTYKEIIAIQIYLRAAIKTEFMFTEFLTPIDFINHYNIANELEQKKQDLADQGLRERYLQQ